MTQVQHPQLGKYRLLEVIAKGGMGEVYKAQQEGPAGFSKTVVVKRVLGHLAHAENFIEMFLEEARLAARLSHPNVVQIFELGEHEGEYFIAMEYIPGPSLQRIRKRLRELERPFPFDIAAYVIAQALQGLHYAHELRDEDGRPLGIVHRDISPDNILVTRDGGVKVVDFGIAKAADAASQTQSGALKGKLAYISPEQVHGQPASPRSDIYAAGVVLYELLTQALPFSAPSSAALLQQIATVDPEPPARQVLDLPPVLSDLVMKALRKNPRERFATAQEMSRALLGALESCQRRVFPEDLSGFLQQLFAQEGSPRSLPVEPRPSLARSTSSPPPPPEESATVSLPGPTSTSARTVVQGPARPRIRASTWAVGGVLLAAVIGVVALRPWEPHTPPLPVALTPTPAPAPIQAPEPVSPAPAPPEAAVAAKAEEPARPPPPPEVTEAPAPPPPVAAPVPAMGRVHVRVNPWAEVFYGGRSLGITPLPAIPLPAGRRTLTLKNTQLGVSRDYRVTVPAHGEVTLKADLLE